MFACSLARQVEGTMEKTLRASPLPLFFNTLLRHFSFSTATLFVDNTGPCPQPPWTTTSTSFPGILPLPTPPPLFSILLEYKIGGGSCREQESPVCLAFVYLVCGHSIHLWQAEWKYRSWKVFSYFPHLPPLLAALVTAPAFQAWKIAGAWKIKPLLNCKTNSRVWVSSNFFSRNDYNKYTRRYLINGCVL